MALERMTPTERVANELKWWRQTWGVSQRVLAERAGTSQRVISLLEAGRYNPSLALLGRMAEAMKLDLDVAFRPR